VTLAVQPGRAAWSENRPTVIDVVCFLGAVFMALTFSQGWITALLGGRAPEASDGALLRAVFYPAYGVAAALAVVTGPALLQALGRSPGLLALLALAAASTIWSVDADATARRVIALAFTTLCGAGIAARFSWATLTEVFAAAFLLLTAGSWTAGLALPELGLMGQPFPGAWRGLWIEKNMLGASMALATCIFAAAAVTSPPRRGLWAVFAGLAAAMVLMSTSKTALLALLVGLSGLVFVGLARRGPAQGVAATWAAVVAVAAAGFALLSAADLFFAILGKDPTLTGRTAVWEAVLRQIQSRPWLGFGYGAVWDDVSRWAALAWIEQEAGFRPTHAHNGWLEAALNLGLAGVALWAVCLGAAWIRTLAETYRGAAETGAYLALPLLATFTVMTLSESVVMNYNDLRWVLFVAVAVKLASEGGVRR
jgi:exopolysaccharide production protein ExoQ